LLDFQALKDLMEVQCLVKSGTLPTAHLLDIIPTPRQNHQGISLIMCSRNLQLKFGPTYPSISDFLIPSPPLNAVLKPVAAQHQGAPGQMIWLEDPPPWLKPWLCPA